MRFIIYSMTLAIALSVSPVNPSRAVAVSWSDPCNFRSTHKIESCFSDPSSAEGRILRSLGSLVAAAKPGDTIRIMMFQWGDEVGGRALPEQLAEEVVAAHREGVDVKVIADERSEGLGPIGILKNGGVPVFVCHDEEDAVDGEDDCLMNETDFYEPGSPLPMNHVKMFLFELGGVPMIAAGSSNLGEWDYRSAWNDFVRIRGDRQLYEWLMSFWHRVRIDDWLGWSTNPDRDRSGDPVSDGDLPERAWVYPRKAPGDPIAGQLDNVTGCSSDGDSDGDWDKRVWVAMSAWSTNKRTRILDQLDRLDSIGCDVEILLNARDRIDHDWVRTIRQRISGDPAAWDEVRVVCNLHHKLIILDARYLGSYHEVAITGSEIFATGSLRNSVELSLRIGGDNQHDNNVVRSYITYFQDRFAGAPNDTCG